MMTFKINLVLPVMALTVLAACGGSGGGSQGGSLPPTSPANPHPLLGTPTMISPTTAGGNVPSISANGIGQAVAVWEQSDALGIEAFASEFVPGRGWTTAHQVNEPAIAPWCNSPKAVIDPNGVIDFIWSEDPTYFSINNQTRFDIYYRRLTPGIGWSSTTKITDMSSKASGGSLLSSIASNQYGEAVLSFSSQFQNVPGGTVYCQLNSMTRSASGTWVSPSIVNPNLDYQVTGWPRSAINNAGSAITLWGNGYGGGIIKPGAINCSFYTKGSQWSPSMEIDGSENDNPYATAIDRSGNAIAVFPRVVVPVGGSIPNWYQLFSSYYSTSSGWSTPTPIGTPQGTYITPNVAFNTSGQACAAWADSFGNVFTALYTPGVGWASTNVLYHNPLSTTWFPEIAATPSGGFIVVWTSGVSATEQAIMCAQWTSSKGWGDYAFISDPTRWAFNYRWTPPYVGADGNLWVVWIDGYDATKRTIWANRVQLN